MLDRVCNSNRDKVIVLKCAAFVRVCALASHAQVQSRDVIQGTIGGSNFNSVVIHENCTQQDVSTPNACWLCRDLLHYFAKATTQIVLGRTDTPASAHCAEQTRVTLSSPRAVGLKCHVTTGNLVLKPLSVSFCDARTKMA